MVEITHDYHLHLHVPMSSIFAVLIAADKLLTVLRDKKPERKPSKGKKRKAAKEEVATLYGRKSAKRVVWKHKFVCLAFYGQKRIPTTDTEKDDLLKAGLGEKEVEFDDLDLDADEFRDVLYGHFPGLKDGGGFQFFKCMPNSRTLEQLSSTTLSSPQMLKSRVGNARTYICPLQRDLDLSPIFDLPSGVR